jgi:hypothetical protein
MRRTLHLTNPRLHDGQDIHHPKDVSYAQHLLNNGIHNGLNTDFHAGVADGTYGEVTAAAAHRAKFWFGYPRSQVDGACGQVLVNLLNGTSKMTPIMRWRRTFRIREARRHNTVREKLAGFMDWSVRNAGSIYYSQGAWRMAGVRYKPYHLPLFTDCSAFATILYKWSGGPDPNGLGYNGFGYTGTIMANCHRLPNAASCEVGDLITFGVYPGHHVTLVRHVGINPLLCSHGQNSDPRFVYLSEEAAGQARSGHGTVEFWRVPGMS